MKKIILAVLFAIIFTLFPLISGAEEQPAENQLTGEFATSVLSAYIWRGQELTRHSVVVQPSVTLGYNGFSANVWGNLDTRPYAAAEDKYSANFTETDVTLSYSRQFGLVRAALGYIYYGLAGANAGAPDLLDSQEVFISVGLDTILAPTLTVYKEIDHYHQWYATLGVSHTFALHDKIGLKLAAGASYLLSTDAETYPQFDSNLTATGDKFNNFYDGVVSISIPVAATAHITIMPTITYVFPLSNDAKYEMKARGLQGVADPSEKDSAFLYGGIVLSFAF